MTLLITEFLAKHWLGIAKIVGVLSVVLTIYFQAQRIDGLKADKTALEYKVGQMEYDAKAVAKMNSAVDKIRLKNEKLKKEILNVRPEDDAPNSPVLLRVLDSLRRE